MDHAPLGTTPIRVSRIILGCGNFGGIGSAPAFFGKGEGRDEAFAVMDAAWAAGITTFDTADAYGGGRSETWIGDWIRARRPQGLVLSTKTFNPMAEGADRGLAPARVRRQLESSLRRFCVERIDMYLAHEWDPDVPIADTAGVFDELVAEGRIGAYGLSNVDGAKLEQARAHGRFGWVQNGYSLLDRDAEREVLPLCERHALGFTPFSPLAGGWLTGKYRRGVAPTGASRLGEDPGRGLEAWERRGTERTWALLDALRERADRLGRTPAGLALAWVTGRPGVASALVGARTVEQLRSSLDGGREPLDPETRQALDALSAPVPPDYPYAFLDEIDPPE